MKLRRYYESGALQRGISLVEVLIAVTIITTGIMALINMYGVYVQYALTHDKTVQATYLLEEGVEAMSLMRDQNWTSKIAALTPATTYALYFDGSNWVMSSTTDVTDGTFYRTVNIANVNRDTGGMIAASGGTLDTSTKLITVNVAYKQGQGTTTVSVSKYLVNMYNN